MAVLHVVAIMLYRAFVGSELHPYLQFPRAEVTLAGEWEALGNP